MGVLQSARKWFRRFAYIHSESRSFKDLARVSDRYTFAIIADPQLMERDAASIVSQTSAHNLSQIIKELNAIRPKLPFVILNGDLVQRMIPSHRQNFLERIQALEPLPILVHGNHDGRSPYTEFQRLQQELNGTAETMFSFDCGAWHFVALPCNINSQKDEAEMLHWLDQDLKHCGDRPVMVFEHLHLLPQGLTQLEWYSFNQPFREKLIDVLSRYGNVRYVFSGHVHNGIKVSVKTAWTYRGIHFITTPTCICSRNFGEEFPQFAAGAKQNKKTVGGGYYLLIDLEQTTVRIRGRMVGTEEEYLYPNQFRSYHDQEPLWFKPITHYPPQELLVNGSFTQGFTGWMQPYRYLTDEKPGFVTQTAIAPIRPGQGVYLFCREKGKLWANEEVLDVYQWVSVSPSEPLMMGGDYWIPSNQLRRGGGYFYLIGYGDGEPRFLLLLDWGNGNRRKNQYTVQHILYTATGQWHKPQTFIQWGQQQRALFIPLPATENQWHSIKVQVNQAYTQATGGDRQLSDFGIERVLLGAGVWCEKRPKSCSGAFFDRLALSSDLKTEHQETENVAIPAIVVDNEPVAITAQAFQTEFGKFYLTGKRAARRRRKRGLSPDSGQQLS